MRVLVVAATGFVGGHIAQAFLSRGDDVCALVRSRHRGEADTRLAGARLTVGTLGALPEEALDGPYDVVAYAAGAWRRDERVSSAESARRCNEVYVRGVETLAARALDWKGHFVFLSGVSRYGSARWPELLREDAPPGELSIYGAHKRRSEAILARLGARGLRWTAVVPPEIYGSHDRGGYVRFVYERVLARRFVLIGRGENRWSLCNVRNIAAAIALWSGGDGAGVVHVADAKPASQRELAASIARAVGRRPSFPEVPRRAALVLSHLNAAVPRPASARSAFSPAHVRVRTSTMVLDLSRAATLGFDPQFGLEDGVREAVGWWESVSAATHPA